MSHSFINVHDFDGKLRDIFKPSRQYSVKEKQDGFDHLITCLTNLAAVATVQTMINDLTFAKGANYQPENNIDASDILIELVQWIDNDDVLKGLNEQLADARNLGICNSGRVTRLLQLWLAFFDNDINEKDKN
jgi:hypothetical protein